MSIRQLLNVGFKEWSHGLNATNKVVLEQVLDIFVGTRQGNWVSLISTPPSKRLVIKKCHNVTVASRHGQRNACRRNTLGSRNDIRKDTLIILKAKELSSTSKSHHDFIGMHENTIFITQCSYTLHISRWHDQTSTRPNNGFHHDGRNGIRSFIENLFFQHLQCRRHLLFTIRHGSSMIEKERKWIKGFDKSRHRVTSIPSTKVPRRSPCIRRGPMVRSIPTHDFLFSGIASRHHDSRLIGFGATGRKDCGA
mmetsp:Transcript_7155/g.13160  ORF Transcript_7155/g.13160 Transcript_7155/m.13160 type:complete len:252 (+) Transcript_7155:389-1144(+)